MKYPDKYSMSGSTKSFRRPSQTQSVFNQRDHRTRQYSISISRFMSRETKTVDEAKKEKEEKMEKVSLNKELVRKRD